MIADFWRHLARIEPASIAAAVTYVALQVGFAIYFMRSSARGAG